MGQVYCRPPTYIHMTNENTWQTGTEPNTQNHPPTTKHIVRDVDGWLCITSCTSVSSMHVKAYTCT